MDAASVRIEESWKRVLAPAFEAPSFGSLAQFVREEYRGGMVYPPPKLIFNAFDLCPFDAVKVVILGQDPYHGAGQAHGLSFSVPDGVRPPPSLQNIYKEIADDLALPADAIPLSGNLEHWARQGVLLLNATLTVRASSPMSHHGKGWEEFTDAAVHALSEGREHLVFLLWGRSAQEKGRIIDRTKHLVLEAPHPSPFSAHTGFFGCKHFSKANAYLEVQGIGKVEWGDAGSRGVQSIVRSP
jgi:uracil-DNA glycosylase